jgi:hypothetical protein
VFETKYYTTNYKFDKETKTFHDSDSDKGASVYVDSKIDFYDSAGTILWERSKSKNSNDNVQFEIQKNDCQADTDDGGVLMLFDNIPMFTINECDLIFNVENTDDNYNLHFNINTPDKLYVQRECKSKYHEHGLIYE